MGNQKEKNRILDIQIAAAKKNFEEISEKYDRQAEKLRYQEGEYEFSRKQVAQLREDLDSVRLANEKRKILSEQGPVLQELVRLQTEYEKLKHELQESKK